MRRCFLITVLLLSGYLTAFDKLPADYLVCYGNPESPLRIVQYYSFACPHCISLFRKQFQQIKQDYIDGGKVSWIFHPVPMDLLTIQAMDCISKLSEREKKIFLEAILEEIYIDEPKLSALLMQKGMELLGRPINDLQEKAYLSETNAFHDAFQFLKQAEALDAIPSVDVNGIFIPAQIPDIAFIEEQLGAHAI